MLEVDKGLQNATIRNILETHQDLYSQNRYLLLYWEGILKA